MFRALCWSLLLVLNPAPAGQVPSVGTRAIAVRPGNDSVIEQRVALVIGNAAYKELPLRNPVNDARAIAKKLRNIGFEVVLRENLQQRQIGSTLREFRSRLTPGAEALFFYAGHGLQVGGVNYLPAVDADIVSEDDVPTQSIDVNKVLDVMESQKTRLNLVFLDACRNNPFTRGFRAEGGGLARITPPSGTILSFATRPGSIAADGTGANGLYTEYLLKAMDEQGIVIEQALKKVLAGVKRASNGKQEPWVEGGIEGNFFFRPGAPSVAVPPPSADGPEAPPSALELAFWESIRTSQNPDDFKAYMAKFPNGLFLELAENRVKGLASAGSPSAGAAAPARPNPMAAQGDTVVPDSFKPGEAWKDPRTGLEFAAIPAGSFQMGSNNGNGDERPVHQVTISRPFLMQRTPVTVAQFKAFAEATGYQTGVEKMGGPRIWLNGGHSMQDPSINWRNNKGDDRPVVWMGWGDARAYTHWLNGLNPGMNYRLPTEAEWEYACRAGTVGDHYGELPAIAWYQNNSGNKLQPVAQKQPNAFGLFDMLGNVWQWCQDWQGSYPDGHATDPKGPEFGAHHACRGGAFSSPPQAIRASRRKDWVALNDAGRWGEIVGFRVVATARTASDRE